MSYETIQEKVEVLASFRDGTIFPKVFKWRGKQRLVDKVNLSYQEREGGSVSYYFAIEANGLVAKLKYNDKSMIWSLEEIWVE